MNLLEKTIGASGFWLVAFVVSIVVYLVVEVVPAFLPGGAVDRVIGGVR